MSEQKIEPCPNDAVLDELVKHLAALGMHEQTVAINELREEYAGLCHDFDRLKAREAEWLNPRPTADLGEDGELVERLRVHARCASDVHRLMAEAKTERQVDGGSYGWIAPEQTDEWQAADRLILYREALEDVLAYREGRKPYDFHRLPDDQRDNEAFDAWQLIEQRLRAVLSRSGG